MDPKTAANAFREIGHPICLSMYRKQVKAGYDGLPAGKVQNSLNHSASTLSYQSLYRYLPGWPARKAESYAAL